MPRNQLLLKTRAALPTHTAALGAPGDQHHAGCFTHGCPEKKRQSRDFHAIPRGTHNGEGKRKRKKKKKTSNRCSRPQNKWHFLTPLIPLMANKLEPQIIIPSPSAAPFICQAQSSPSINSSRLVTPCKGWKYPSVQLEKQTSSWS